MKTFKWRRLISFYFRIYCNVARSFVGGSSCLVHVNKTLIKHGSKKVTRYQFRIFGFSKCQSRPSSTFRISNMVFFFSFSHRMILRQFVRQRFCFMSARKLIRENFISTRNKYEIYTNTQNANFLFKYESTMTCKSNSQYLQMYHTHRKFYTCIK